MTEELGAPLPKLHQILSYEIGGDPASWPVPEALLEEDVVEVLLATGSPCDSHAGAFADWPGEEGDVARWFKLASGPAVGIREDDGGTKSLALHRQEEGG